MIADLQNMNVTVLMGGDSAEREISLKSGTAVADALESAGAGVTRLDTAAKGWHRDLPVKTFVFNLLHGVGGEDGQIQGLLESLGVHYSGSGVLGSALCMDKAKTKLVWQSLGLPTPDFQIIDNRSDLAAVIDRLGSVFVKPVSEGSSVGMSKATDVSSLERAWVKAAESGVAVMAETLVDGDEFTVAILRGRPLPPIKITPASEFYDFDAKYVSGATQFECPAPLNEEETAVLQALALEAFDASGAEIWGRVDLMRDASGWQLLEVNTVPGMTEHSLVPKAAAAAGLSFTELLMEIYLGSMEVRYGT
ncbi:MAG: D-alanine--D-alanine ligase [Luminiphilus sp.]|nr:D-alanine--D-alanine ligase [Luminiphilus sp.]